MKNSCFLARFMKKKFVAILIALGILMFATFTKGAIEVGVEKGDWIEYTVTTSGTPPDAHHIIWARMEILDVNGTVFSANITSEFPNGTFASAVRHFNFEEGQVQAWIIIPANLSPGDSFYDVSIGRNVTIEGQEEKSVAGAVRTITHASNAQKYKEWDKITGVYTFTRDSLESYSVNATAIATNMWSPQIFGLDQTVFFGIVIAIVVVVIVALAVLLLARRKK